MQEDLLAFVKRRLRADGPKKWPEVAQETGRGVALLRKIAYGDRKNTKLDTIQPVVTYYQSRPESRAPN